MADWNGRVGAGKVARLGGVRRECDPGAIPLAPVCDFRDLENGRWRGPHVVNRGGQEKLTSGGALSGAIDGIFMPEFQSIGVSGISNGPRIYGVVSDTQLYAFDKNLVTPSQRINIGSSIQMQSGYAYNGFVYLGSSLLAPGKGYRFASTPIARSGVTLVSKAPAPTELFTFPANNAAVWGMRGIGSQLFWAVERSDAVGWRVYRTALDGTSVTLEDTVAPGGGSVVGEPAIGIGANPLELFVGGGDPAGATIRRRTATGTWSTLGLPGTPVGFGVDKGTIIAYNGATYFGGRSSAGFGWILKWDGSSVTAVRGPLGTTAGVFGGFAVLRGVLYYMWSDTVGGGDLRPKIGSYDGTNWNDSVKDFSGQLGTAAWSIFGLVEYEGELYTNLEAASAKLMRSTNFNIPGTWAEVDTVSCLFSDSAESVL